MVFGLLQRRKHHSEFMWQHGGGEIRCTGALIDCVCLLSTVTAGWEGVAETRACVQSLGSKPQ